MDFSKLNDEKKNRLKTILELGKVFGGTKEADQFLMGEMMNVLLPETDKLDEIASAGTVLNDIGGAETPMGKLFLNEWYKQNGVNPDAQNTQDVLMGQFKQEFPTDVQDPTQNMQMQDLVAQNPQLLQQYYNTTPEKGSFVEGFSNAYDNSYDKPTNLGLNTAFAGVPDLVRRLVAAYQGYKGGFNASRGESKDEKIQRLKNLSSQYTPKN